MKIYTVDDHGGCDWCYGNRIHKNEKRKLAAEQRIEEFIRRNCKWRDDFTWACCNGDSPMVADFVDDDYCQECRLFEVK